MFPLLKIHIDLSSGASLLQNTHNKIKIKLVRFYLNQLMPTRGGEPWDSTLKSVDGQWNQTGHRRMVSCKLGPAGGP